MNLCEDCSLNKLCGQRFAVAVEYTDRYDEAIMDGDQTGAAALVLMAEVELPAGIARPAQACLRRRQMGQCVLKNDDVELVV